MIIIIQLFKYYHSIIIFDHYYLIIIIQLLLFNFRIKERDKKKLDEEYQKLVEGSHSYLFDSNLWFRLNLKLMDYQGFIYLIKD